MTRCIVLIAALSLAALTSGASNFESLGYSDETTIVGPGSDACADGSLVNHHDGSFENGYSWAYPGCQPPYYGAFGEGYDLGPGTVFCGAYWLTTLPGLFNGQTADCYIWEGGTDTPPDAVVGVVTGIVFGNVAIWPQVGQNDVDLNFAVTGPFTVGYWGNWPGTEYGWFCAADLNGPQGHPWTCIAPGIGYPTGWADPSLVFGPTRSMGCGGYFGQGVPVEAPTWGVLKTLFR